MKTLQNNPLCKPAGKRLLFAIALLLLTVNAFGETTDKTRKKEIYKQYDALPGTILKIENIFGNIFISYWDKEEVEISASIEIRESETTIDDVGFYDTKIEINKSGKTIFAKTTVNNPSLTNRRGWKRQKFDNGNLEINYHVKMPASTTIDLFQSFGCIRLPEKVDGKAFLQIRFGDLTAGSFTQYLNLKGKFSKITMEHLQNAEIDVEHCENIFFRNGDHVKLNSSFSRIEMRDIKKLEVSDRHGFFCFQSSGDVTVDMSFSNAHFHRITGELTLKSLKHGTATIQEVSPDFKLIKANANFGTLNIGVPPLTSFSVKGSNMNFSKVNVRDFDSYVQEVSGEKTYYYRVNNGDSGKCLIEFTGNHSTLNVGTPK